MTAKLNDEDGRAIDVLLNRPTALDDEFDSDGRASGGAGENSANDHDGMRQNGGGHDGDGLAGVMHGVFSEQFQHRIKAAERVLNLLGTMAVGEPPAGLLERTLARIKNSTGAPVVPVDVRATRPEA